MDLRKIKKLMELAEESGVVELEVRSGEESVRIVRPGGQAAAVVAPLAPAAVPLAANPAADGAVTTLTENQSANQSAKQAASSRAVPVSAPMAGTFYAAPTPDSEPYVAVGDKVRFGDVLCIIESMKMMNEVTAPADGTIVAIDVANGQPISTGERLFALA